MTNEIKCLTTESFAIRRVAETENKRLNSEKINCSNNYLLRSDNQNTAKTPYLCGGKRNISITIYHISITFKKDLRILQKLYITYKRDFVQAYYLER